MNGWIRGGPPRLPLVARCTTHCTTPLPSLAPYRAPSFLAPLSLGLPPLCSPRDYPGFGGCAAWWGWGGGGLPDGGSPPPPPWNFPLGGPMLALPVMV